MPNFRFAVFAVIAVFVTVGCFAQEVAFEGQKGKDTMVPTEYTESEYRISASLSDGTNVDASEMPLSKLLLELSGMHNIRIVVDGHALADLGIRPEQPVTFVAKDVTLGVAIGRLTDMLNLTYVVHDESVLLTSSKVAAREQDVKVMMVSNALEGQEGKIIRDVTEFVRPEL
ncbi:hypothetical protein Poly51_63060 [Rubripirellula tenax]|uniref:Preprotein translocase subunit SecD n=1 Tax=Rubripirellula tenax TaxID=2528015 RepID=A0A5C6E507_9BACT|nr:hypothetical protein [Rubripirellula tenax]TWU43584.1 hypothetical protein Poly51_63060 [Rubripirellula tenax]